MPSKYNDGLVHGHCRYGECSVVMIGGGWQDRITGDPFCLAGPWLPCDACGGLGYFQPPDVFDPGAGAEDPETGELMGAMVTPPPVRCELCQGSGEVPGPHWPWRF